MKTSSKATVIVTSDVDPMELCLSIIEGRARSSISPDAGDHSGDTQILHRRTESLINELEAEDDASDGKSSLLNLPESRLTWVEVFNALLERSRKAVASPSALIAASPIAPTDTLQAAFLDCEATRNRVLQAVGGSEPKSADALLRKEAIFNRPAFSPSKPAWENELRSIITAINNPGPHQTPALKRLVPRVEQSLARLQKAKPQVGGRPTKATRWSEEVVLAQAMLALAISDFVQWAASEASDTRNAAILRIAAPKRRGDETGLADPAPRKSEPRTRKGDAPSAGADEASKVEEETSEPQPE